MLMCTLYTHLHSTALSTSRYGHTKDRTFGQIEGLHELSTLKGVFGEFIISLGKRVDELRKRAQSLVEGLPVQRMDLLVGKRVAIVEWICVNYGGFESRRVTEN